MSSIHTSRDSDNDNHSETSGSSEGDAHSNTHSQAHITQDHGPEAENLTSYSQRRRRKSRRKTMGMHRPDYIIRGSDPFDYEQKFPEDKQYEELGPLARVWRTYLEECVPFDIEMVEGWRDGLDVLLVFAGLFSAVVTTFVAQTSQSLQVDYGQVTASLLIELINVQRSASNGSLVNDVPQCPTRGLATALFAVLTKQWIHEYMSVPSGTPRDRCRMRQFRYMGLQQWGVAFIIGILPVLMSASLAVFLVGLVLFIVPLRVPIAGVVGAITFISFSAYIVTNFLPILYPSCPYKTPLSQYVFPVYTYILHNVLFNGHKSPISKDWTPFTTSDVRTLRDAERVAVEVSADETDVQALAWLIHMSSNPSVENIVLESMIGYALDLLRTAFLSMAHIHAHETHQSKLDRLLRAYLRFPSFFCPRQTPLVAKDHVSPVIYAELLSTCGSSKSTQKEIGELIVSNLKAPDDSPTALCLHPIVWARLLRNLSWVSSPDDAEVMRMLFDVIPSSYWGADFTRPTEVFQCKEMTFFKDGDDGTATTIRDAICKSLYLYVAEVILPRYILHERQGDWARLDRELPWDWATHVRFSQVPTNTPIPEDLRLRLLLSMADWPSIRNMPASGRHPFDWNGIHFYDTPFISILQIFCRILDVQSRGQPSYDSISAVPLDSNRHAVLQFLYIQILSDEFDNTLAHHTRALTLTTFLRVLHSTMPLPPFLAKDWCTPQQVFKYAQIAFDSPSGDSLPDLFNGNCNYHHDLAGELVPHVFCSTSFTDEAMAYFLSNLFRQLWSDKSPIPLLDLIVTALTSENMDVEIRRRSLDYLYKPDNLLIYCRSLIRTRGMKTLRRLALLRPKDPAWSGCLQLLLQGPQGHEMWDWQTRDFTRIPQSITTNFKAFIEAGCVGAFGQDDSDTAPPNSTQSAQGEDVNSSQHLWSTMWRTVRQLIAGRPSHAEIELSSADSEV
ncbi:uncharacterized protein ARMOST_01295 [Armillaria ostoyae]|uniref:DUF6535 domain-containing protein n=1 Tax=Armillaria ostoyae TaxID=47428 RepID=A0A284QNJ2_ARMOS|nr:uncharacterized protein ARMOST_01295 [Armillaria ostoyae]